jgi:ABC-2 type transport system permease protein
MIRRLYVIGWKELLQLRRDRLTLAMMAVLPLMQLLLFGFAVNTDVRHIPTVVFDQDGTAQSRDFARALQTTGYFDIVGRARDYAEIDRAIRGGTAHAALVVPPHYASDLKIGRATRLQLVVDGTDPQIVGSATSAAGALAAARSTELLATRLARSGVSTASAPLDLVPSILYNPDQRTAVNIVPGLVGVILSLTMVMLTSMALARERERGTMEQLIVSPVRTIELIVGKILPYIAIGYVQMAIILAAGRIVFDVPIVGSTALLFALAFVFIAANLAVGIFFSTIAKTQQQAMQMSLFFLLPNILLSGFVFPFDAMPLIPRILAQGLPLTHFIRVLRAIVLRGSTMVDLVGEVVWMGAILVVLVVLSSLRFRKKIV